MQRHHEIHERHRVAIPTESRRPPFQSPPGKVHRVISSFLLLGSVAGHDTALEFLPAGAPSRVSRHGALTRAVLPRLECGSQPREQHESFHSEVVCASPRVRYRVGGEVRRYFQAGMEASKRAGATGEYASTEPRHVVQRTVAGRCRAVASFQHDGTGRALLKVGPGVVSDCAHGDGRSW